ncbi:DUF5686 and carboxypeptidase regulatory-like domain-containing protein [Alistipes sp. OttesenSCG-928-L06]|nr:DUF5686 and carboxypeptidase regulatory-like domain-containing protein [Alistipes sp. OttesenSCG-928-L06]
MRSWRAVIGLLWCLVLCGMASAQSTRVRGRVTDAATGEPIPFASLSFKGTTIGTSADMEGHYNLEIRDTVTQLSATFLSYEPQTVTVSRGTFQTVDFALTPVVTEIERVVVKFENQAIPILRQVIRNKPRNNPAEKESYQYSTYTKMELDMANMERFRNKRLQRNFGFVFEYLDTSAMTGRAYLPVMITESTTDNYFQRSPRLKREVVKASRISGVDDYNFAQFTGGLYVDVNLYDNYVNIFEVNIPSPLCDHGQAFYDYFLIDSLDYGGRKTYHIRFHPKSLGSPVFDGEINVDATDWALRSAKMRLAKGINVNWLRDLFIENTNEPVGDSLWFKKQDRIVADLSLTMRDSSKLISFMAQRQIDYSDIRIDEPIPDDILKLRNNIVMDNEVLRNDNQYWNEMRPYELSAREKGIYQMVDSVKNVPLFRNIYDLVNTVVIGYQQTGPIELGSLYSLFSFNDLEGGRVQLNVRTHRDLSEKIRLSAYGAYGFKDREFKGGGGVEYMFSHQPTRKLTLTAKHDVLQLSAGNGVLAQGNILSSVFARGDTERLIMLNQVKGHYEQEWSPGFTNTLAVEWREMLPTKYVHFNRPDGTEPYHIRSTEVTLGNRFSRDEIIHRKPFTKYHMGSNFPVVNLELTAGLKEVFRSDYEYYRTVLGVEYHFNIPPIGRSHLHATAGKIFGKVPYPLLKMHEGNATYFYDKNAFSCMDFYEFASDTWASVIYEHHFRGFFLSRIPLMKRLKWREVAIVKALWGSLENKNDGSFAGHIARMDFPEGMSSVSKPYIEAGFGVENIFRFCRLDAIWRITHRNNHAGQKVDNFALNFSMHFDF